MVYRGLNLAIGNKKTTALIDTMVMFVPTTTWPSINTFIMTF